MKGADCMGKPKVICHMTVTLDGKVTGDFWETEAGIAAADAYYEVNRLYKADAFACGRVTMIGSFTHGWQPDLTPFADAQVPEGDFVAQQAEYYAVAFDRRGSLGWRNSHIYDEDPGYDNAHIIEIVCADADKAYLAYLRTIGVSYIIGGDTELDLKKVLGKLKSLFGIKTLLLEGGGTLNGSFQRADLIDEVSIILAPIVAGEGEKNLFEGGSTDVYHLHVAKGMEGGSLWLLYKK